MKLLPETMIRRTEGVMSSPLDLEMLLLNPDRNNYVCLDDIGRRVWELLAAPTSWRDLCAQLAREFNADPELIASDTVAYLDDLAAEGLIDVCLPCVTQG